MLRYAISDRRLFPGNDRQRQACVVQQAATLAREGVDYFQVREKDLAADALFDLICAVRDAIQATGSAMHVLLNGPHALAQRAAVGWHGSGAYPAPQSPGRTPVSTSVHTVAQIEQQRERASLLLFAPVFQKVVAPAEILQGTGIESLRAAVIAAGSTPVLALGGVTLQNAPLCLAAGAAGIAGIRLFLRS